MCARECVCACVCVCLCVRVCMGVGVHACLNQRRIQATLRHWIKKEQRVLATAVASLGVPRPTDHSLSTVLTSQIDACPCGCLLPLPALMNVAAGFRSIVGTAQLEVKRIFGGKLCFRATS